MAQRRRKLVWARTISSIVLGTAPAASGVDLLAAFRTQMGILAGPPGATIMRIRQDIVSLGASQTSAAPVVGIRVIDAASLAEVTSDPTHALELYPGRDPHADWMMWRVLMPNHGADPTTGNPNAATYEMDIRAMRKVDELGQTLAFIAGKETSTFGVSLQVATSVLVALP